MNMKTTKYLFGLVVAVMAMLTSCNKDNEGAIYNSDNGAVSFTSTNLGSVTVLPNDPTFEVEIVRGNTSNDLTGKISVEALIGKTPLEGVTVSDYSFKAGENKTTIKVDVTPLEIGYVLTVNLKIDDSQVSIGGNAATTLKVNKAYNWVSLGTGTFTDNFCIGDIAYDVEIQKAEGFDRWRVIAPYDESMKNDDGGNGDWLAGEAAPYIEFWLTDAGYVDYNEFFTGLNYQADGNSPIYAYPPTAFYGIDPKFNKFLDDKTVQLAPYFYVPSLSGGWDYTAVEGTIIITLP